MLLKARTFLLMLALGACSTERPEGAYLPVYSDGAVTGCRPGFTCGRPDTGVPNLDGGGSPELDAGRIEEENPYADSGLKTAALGGRYLMRIDYYSTLQEMESGTTLTLKTRVSNLFFTQLAPVGTLNDNEFITATEKLCFQSSVHECESGCTNWTTTYADVVPLRVQSLLPVSRGYLIEPDGTLKVAARGALLRLGFDDAVFSTAPIPQNTDDPRVWKLGDDTSRLRGVATYLEGRVGPPVLQLPLDCEVDTVQVFATAFTAKLPNLDAEGLAQRVMEVDATGSAAYPLVAIGEPPQLCNLSRLQAAANGGGSSGERGFVRFQRTALSNCPADVNAFENEFRLPAGENLNPPNPTDPLVP